MKVSEPEDFSPFLERLAKDQAEIYKELKEASEGWGGETRRVIFDLEAKAKELYGEIQKAAIELKT